MIRFVDLRPADISGIRFSFWDTVHNRFIEFYGDQAWGTMWDFQESCKLGDADPAFAKRLTELAPDWARQPWDVQNDWREWLVVQDPDTSVEHPTRTEYYQPFERFVVKVQLPTLTNDPDMLGKCLVYDEHRIVEAFLPVDEDIKRIMDGERKRYFWAFFLEDGTTLNFWTEDGLPDQDPGW